MGYWSTSLDGASLQLYGDLNPDGSEMLWGDAPADRIDSGIDSLIGRLRDELGRFPSVEEVDAVKDSAPEMLDAIAAAREVFAQDVEREMSDGELAAGLLFADTALALDFAIRRDIQIGDSIRFGVFRDCGFFREIDRVADAVVEFASTRTAEGILGPVDVPVFLAREADGTLHTVDVSYASKVLPGDESVDEVNDKREQRSESL